MLIISSSLLFVYFMHMMMIIYDYFFYWFIDCYYYYYFFLQIGDLYEKDACDLELAADFWCPTDTGLGTSFSPYTTGMSSALRQRASQKQVRSSLLIKM